MSKQVTLYNLLISCPSDVEDEVQIIKDVVDQFNSHFYDTLGIGIQTKDWKQNSYSQSGGHPQDLLNEQFVFECDAAVAVFWTRFGTPTDRFGSGTEEEIEIMLESGKQVFMYFSDKPVPPSQQDSEGYKKICDFREKYNGKGIWFPYCSNEEFEKLFFANLTDYFLNKFHEGIESRKSNLRIVGIDREGCLVETAQIIKFEPGVVNTKAAYMSSICNYFSEIINISIAGIIERAEKGFSLAQPFYNPVKIDDQIQSKIRSFAKYLEIDIPDDFFYLGDLQQDLSSSGILYGVVKGTPDEEKKYNEIIELYETILNYLAWAPVEQAFSDKYCLKLALQNSGTAIDEDVEITIKIPQKFLLWINDFPNLEEDSARFLLEDCDIINIFGIGSSAHCLDYSASTKNRNVQEPLPDYYDPMLKYDTDYVSDYIEELENVFCYSVYTEEENYIIKLKIDYIKHNTAVAFPTVLFISEPVSEIEYEISSKNLPEIIKDTLSVECNG